MNMIAATVVDARGKVCPMPILMLQKAMPEVEPGHIIGIVGDDEGMIMDVPAWCKSNGHRIVKTELTDILYKFWIQK
jgi:TusA-related sulfurtransferase